MLILLPRITAWRCPFAAVLWRRRHVGPTGRYLLRQTSCTSLLLTGYRPTGQTDKRTVRRTPYRYTNALYRVPQNDNDVGRHSIVVQQSTDFDNFCQKCYRESTLSDAGLFYCFKNWCTTLGNMSPQNCDFSLNHCILIYQQTQKTAENIQIKMRLEQNLFAFAKRSTVYTEQVG